MNSNRDKSVLFITDGTVKGELPRRALNLVYDWLDLHHDKLLNNWNLALNEEPLNPIEPLQ